MYCLNRIVCRDGRLRQDSQDVSETRGIMGRSRFPGNPVVSFLPPKATVPICMEKTKSKYKLYFVYTY